MERKDKLIFAAILAALAGVLAIEWLRGKPPAAVVATVTGADADAPISTGLASAWANVPVSRLMLPPSLAGYMVPDGGPADENSSLYSCGACGNG